MERVARTMKVIELKERFPDIAFPDYQREPTVWSREQKQRLLDSMVRRFDIASIYLYQREDGGLECIDGRQRINAIMSFLGENPRDEEDNRFALRIQNEVADEDPPSLRDLDGSSFDDLDPSVRDAVLGYEFAAIFLSGSLTPEEFNLQFLRLNLGTLINAGEKLHAMVGVMRELLFDSERLGLHPFLDRVGIPTRRYAKQQIAAQVMLQVFSWSENEEFSRARHFDLQKFLKTQAEADIEDPRVQEVMQTLDVLEAEVGDGAAELKNRGISVSVIAAAWVLRLFDDDEAAAAYAAFLQEFLGRLRWQVQNMKAYEVDDRYDYLVEFQRHITQAVVEKPALAYRHRILTREFEGWLEREELTGDAQYRQEEKTEPPLLALG